MCQAKPYYKQQFGEELDPQSFGFKGLTELIKDCASVVHLDIDGSIIHISPLSTAQKAAAKQVPSIFSSSFFLFTILLQYETPGVPVGCGG